MKHFVLGAIASLALTGAAQAADPVLGTWQTEPDDGYYVVNLQECGNTICGIITSRIDGDGNETGSNVGKKLVHELKNEGGGAYSGKLWHPGKDKIFTGKASLQGDKMNMKGCTFGGLICLGQTWKRVN